MSISDGTTEANVGTDGAVVWTLGTWVTIVWPAEWLLGELGGLLNKSVFLFDTVPGLLTLDGGLIPNLVGKVSEVGVGWDKFLAGVVLPVEGLAHDDDVVTSAEWISEVSAWLKDNLRLFGDSLISG